MPEFIKVLESITPESLEINIEDYFQNTNRLSTSTVIYTADVGISMFGIPKGKKLPLHDHPQLVGIIKNLFGTV